MEAVEAAELAAKPVSLVPHIRGSSGSPTPSLPTGGPSWGQRDKEENAIEEGNRRENQCENQYAEGSVERRARTAGWVVVDIVWGCRSPLVKL